MAKLEIEDVLAHQKFECEFAPGRPTLITGKNETGKTSIAATLAALAAHEPNPLGYAGTTGKHYVHDGAREGRAKLTVGENEAAWRPPVQSIASLEGADPVSSPGAVGMVDFIDIQRKPPKIRLGAWEALFLPNDPAEILRPHWPADDMHQLNAVVEMISKSGWAAALKVYEEQRKDAKRRWQATTGESAWGSAKGSTWTPDHWRPQYEGRSRADFEADLTNARDALTALTSRIAVGESEIERARENVEKIPGVKDRIAGFVEAVEPIKVRGIAIKAEIKNLDEELIKLNRKIDEARSITDQEPEATCPHCGCDVKISGKTLEVFKPPSAEEIKAAEAIYKTALTEVATVRAKKEKLTHEITALKSQYHEIDTHHKNAQAELKLLSESIEVAEATPSTDDDRHNMADAENNVEKCQQALTAWSDWTDAKQSHENIVHLDRVVEILGPSGPRRKLIEAGFKKLAQIFQVTASAAGWRDVKITDTGAIESNGRPVIFTSESAKLKTQWIAQFAWAIMTGSQVVVLDRADTLRDESWSGLLKVVEKLSAKYTELIVVVCATSVDKPGDPWDVVELSAK